MANNNSDKLISGLTSRKYLKCTKTGFESLVEQGIIQAYRDKEMRRRVSKDSVMGRFLLLKVKNMKEFCFSKVKFVSLRHH